MRQIFATAVALGLGLSLAAAQDKPQSKGQSKSATPAEQYRAIVREYDLAASGTGVTSDEERRKVIARVDKLRPGLAQKFLELAEEHPTDPIAVDALMRAVWTVNNNAFPTAGKDGPGAKAMTLLLRDHVRSEKLGPICLRMSAGFRGEYETFLRTILELNPHRNVQALAHLALAQFLNDRLQRVGQIREDPELAKEYEKVFGRDLLLEFERKDAAAVDKEVEALYEQARDKYADEKIPYAGTVGEQAKAALFEFRHLRVGREAPDIEGEDQDGQRFKLSDYRGQVVLLDFWNEY